MRCECPEHRCDPDPRQTERYTAAGRWELCAFCFSMGHAAPWRLACMASEEAGRRGDDLRLC